MVSNSVYSGQSISKALKGDWPLVICLMISVTTLFVHYYEVLAIIPAFFLVRGKISVTGKKYGMLLLLFAFLWVLSYLIRDDIDSKSNYLTYFFPPLFFVVGSYFGSRYRNNENVIVFILFGVMLMYSAYEFIQLIRFVMGSGEMVVYDRVVTNESGQALRAATGYAILTSVLIAGLCFIFIPSISKPLRFVRIFAIILGLAALYGMVTIITRTSVYEAAAVISLSAYMFLKERRKNNASIFVLILIVLMFGIIIYLLEFSNYSVYISAFSERNALDEEFGGGRLSRWTEGLVELIANPMGTPDGYLTRPGFRYCHNMWLDIGIRAGWIPFIITIIISVNNIKQSFRLWKDRSYSYSLRLYVVCLMAVFVIGCFVEPILGSIYNHFLVYIFFCGVVSELKPKYIN